MHPFLEELVSLFPTINEFLLYDEVENIVARRKHSQEYMRWASTHTHVHWNKDNAPDGILPNKRHLLIHDFRVQCRRGPDDAVYDKHADLRSKLARGNTVIQVVDGPDAGFYLCIYALKKFTGQTPVDDDDRADNVTSSRPQSSMVALEEPTDLYFTEPASRATRIVSTWKANGEACHLSVLRIEGTTLWITGTKNTHLVVRNREDIARYSDNRYNVCKGFADGVFNMLDSLENDKREGLETLLWLTGWTMVFEILDKDHQHVEDLSDVPKRTLHFIAWTSTDPEYPGLTALPPDEGLELARKFGLQVINYTVISPKDRAAHYDEIKRTNYREGNVLYYLNNEGKTIGLVKTKTAWYVLCRAIREKAKYLASSLRRNPTTASLSGAIDKTHKRIDAINKFLFITIEEVMHWKSLATAFLRFVDAGVRDGSVQVEGVFNLFPMLWRRCMREKQLNDAFRAPVESLGDRPHSADTSSD